MSKATTYRFWIKLAIGGPDECWIWKGTTDRDGYGRFTWNGKKWSVHRLIHLLTTGKTPPVVMHKCDNPACCNPSHLKGGTQQDNVRDRQQKERQARGSRNGRAKLDEQRVRMIKRQLLKGASQAALARAYGVSPSVIRDINRGKTWAHVSPLEIVEIPVRDDLPKAA